MLTRPTFWKPTLSGNWQEEPLTLILRILWMTALAITGVIFLTRYVSIGAPFIQDLTPMEQLIVSPVLILLATSFFLMTWLITGGLLILFVMAIIFSLSWIWQVTKTVKQVTKGGMPS